MNSNAIQGPTIPVELGFRFRIEDPSERMERIIWEVLKVKVGKRGHANRPTDSVDASPVKSFFVSMLTRDIALEDAILDLLDNCVDGAIRLNGDKRSKSATAKKPFVGFWAKILISPNSFEIEDNCGGIPANLHEYAFRMGRDQSRPPETKGTVGAYGIGMKRAIFKIGTEATISSRTRDEAFEINISSNWINDEEDWSLPLSRSKPKASLAGTAIRISELTEAAKQSLSSQQSFFLSELEKLIATHYARIIEMGFSVSLNEKAIKPVPVKLLYADVKSEKGRKAIRPFIWEGEIESVSVKVIVGFIRPLISEIEIDKDKGAPQSSSIKAGWTVICNDRVVLYSDRTELTGWGEATVPRFHNQFNCIAGIVEFSSAETSRLPTTTTKRGIDTSSKVYLQAKNKMREGVRLFVDFTNRWKQAPELATEYFEEASLLSIAEIESAMSNLKKRKSSSAELVGFRYMPKLPDPPSKKITDETRISFTRKNKEVQILAEYLFEDESADATKVGERCFDLMLKEAKV